MLVAWLELVISCEDRSTHVLHSCTARSPWMGCHRQADSNEPWPGTGPVHKLKLVQLDSDGWNWREPSEIPSPVQSAMLRCTQSCQMVAEGRVSQGEMPSRSDGASVRHCLTANQYTPKWISAHIDFAEQPWWKLVLGFPFLGSWRWGKKCSLFPIHLQCLDGQRGCYGSLKQAIYFAYRITSLSSQSLC